MHGIGSADLEMHECSDGFVGYNSAKVADFLEFGGGFAALVQRRVYAMQGNTAKAQASYQDFLTLWKDADATFPS